MGWLVFIRRTLVKPASGYEIPIEELFKGKQLDISDRPLNPGL